MTDSFESWINSMSEQDYEDFIEEEGTEAQVEKALNIRTPISSQEEEDLDLAQQGEPELESSRIEEIQEPEPRRKEPDIVFDNRDLPPETRTITIEIPRDNTPARVLPKQTQTQLQQQSQQQTIQQPITGTKTISDISRSGLRSTVTPTGLPAKPASSLGLGKQPSFFQRIRTSFSRLLGRNKK